MGALGLDDTHGILRRPGVEMLAKSEGLRWSGAFAAMQREVPYEASFPAVDAHLMILHLDGPVKVDRWLGGGHASEVIQPGGTFIMPGGIDFRVRLGGALSTVHFYLGHHVLAEVARELSASPDGPALRPRMGGRDPLLESLILGVRDELLDPGLMGDGYVDYLARAAAARLVRMDAASSARLVPDIRCPGTGSRKIARAIAYLNAHLHRKVSLDELAGVLDISVSQMLALFKKTVGAPPHRYILTLRVARARDLLRRGDLPLVQVALACGFAHQEHMTRVFKRELNVTPGAYRRSSG